ncbi:RNA polymerase sigma-70 factor [Flavivirga jejuensis]|uniref:RNA polymerase sigma-70 factor n=1 Tax=Flavivirga jejuensis TaxID=870487 RepID=A0ABT8WT13_9FLAO|nr:RNA polymerase sigma-70 factor [Flavivirga jejuensis]MDO5976336.1 RNA polymerase sigma-70 factor [Flavivirga jejuensis]
MKKAQIYKTPTDFRTQKGFDTLYEGYARKLFTICYSRIQHREDSEEIVHDIFRSIWERRNQIYNTDGSIEKYLIRATKLKTIDFFRKKHRQALHHVEDMELLSDVVNTTEDDYAVAELQTKVDTLVEQLPKTCKTVYLLSREQGLSNKKIASQLVISVKTVESHMTKALRYLRENITEYSYTVLLFFYSNF